VVTTPPPPHYFASAADFRRWLETHHDAHRELVVGFRKVGTGMPSMTGAIPFGNSKHGKAAPPGRCVETARRATER
jgi:hypothetical protein